MLDIKTIFEIVIGIFAGYCCSYFVCIKLANLTPRQVVEKYLEVIEEKLININKKLNKL